MNVGQLRKMIADVPDDVKLYQIVEDHEAVELWFNDWNDWFVTYANERTIHEFFDDEHLFGHERKLRALVTGS